MEGRLEGKILVYHDIGLSVEEISTKMNLSVDEIQEVLKDDSV